ncbi:MAG: energy transducer TonB [Taibaiella sp.]|nr:energy transducer TonB [Taibaiella sp.]
MKTLILLFPFLCIATLSFAQTDTEKVYTYADKMPEFKGNLVEYFENTLVYPEDAKTKHIDGKVVVRFVVNENGKVSNATIARSVYPSLDSEALRTISQMPFWKPGANGSNKVRVSQTLPITFKLFETNDSNYALSDSNSKEWLLVDKLPQFKGTFKRYFDDMLFYPSDAKNAGIEGTVKVKFTISDSGQVSNIQILQTLYPSLDSEAIRLMSMMPKWRPALSKGKQIQLTQILPITFKLSDTAIAYDTNRIYFYVEKYPVFEGSYMEFLKQNLRYPVDARDNDKQGKVLLQFVINKQGKVEDVTVAESAYLSLDAEALRCIRKMPDWKPGMQKEKPVKVRQTIPIFFKLQ